MVKANDLPDYQGVTPDTAVDLILEELSTVNTQLHGMSGWSLDSMRVIFSAVLGVVDVVERVADEVGNWTSADKKKVAVEAVNRLIDIPYLPEFVEAKVFELLIEFAVYTIT